MGVVLTKSAKYTRSLPSVQRQRLAQAATYADQAFFAAVASHHSSDLAWCKVDRRRASAFTIVFVIAAGHRAQFEQSLAEAASARLAQSVRVMRQYVA
ncbi:hypothetical protein [Paraburkholderia solisilvae]|uniref:hypothetical protein n=1 Tax=Paraburkholderia solisilvae TaxID=624376 RepID=UPI001FEBBDA5|nr:hypothetical protein [Paraburkholderia solisilvae]